MSSLTMKRGFVFLVSGGLGFLVGWLLITAGFNALPLISSIETPQAVTIAEYGYQYFFWTAMPIGVVFVIWLDAVMDTGILPD
ncbi:MAG: hypothetical protein AAFR81_14480 [Chloroflexota bacterium]